MSLDLSADLLVSDLAPIPALIQRMGRLNRRITPSHPGQPRQAIVLEPDIDLPYESKQMDSARDWLRALGPASLSQAALATANENIMQTESVPIVESAWLDGGPFSRPAPLREAGVTIAIILAEDEAACVDQSGRPVSKEIARYSIPMTMSAVAKEFSGWKRLGFVFVAPPRRVDYSEKWGARWAKL